MTPAGVRALAAGLVAAALVVPAAAAETFSNRRVRVVVPFAAGGPADVVARMVAERLPDDWRRLTVVENLPGSSSNAGTAAVAHAPADGYTILATTNTVVTNPSLFASLEWDPVRDFAPVTLVATSAAVLAVNPTVPAHGVGELVDLLKASGATDPKFRYSYASPGIGTTAHLTAELFRLSAGVDLIHVPFGGSSPALAATLGGHTQVLFATVTGLVGSGADGGVRALAVASAGRARALPGVPTFAEAGYPGLESVFFQGMLAPAGTPRDVVERWRGEIVRILAVPEVRDRLAAIGYEPVGSTPEAFDALIRTEVPRWAGVIRDAGIERIQ